MIPPRPAFRKPRLVRAQWIQSALSRTTDRLLAIIITMQLQVKKTRCVKSRVRWPVGLAPPNMLSFKQGETWTQAECPFRQHPLNSTCIKVRRVPWSRSEGTPPISLLTTQGVQPGKAPRNRQVFLIQTASPYLHHSIRNLEEYWGVRSSRLKRGCSTRMAMILWTLWKMRRGKTRREVMAEIRTLLLVQQKRNHQWTQHLKQRPQKERKMP